MTDNLHPQAQYDIWLLGSTGIRFLFLDFALSFSFTRAFGTVGRFSINLPLDDRIKEIYLRPDHLVQFWRDGTLEFMGMIRGIEYYEKEGIDYVTLTGEDGVSILRSRIVAYKSGTSQTIGGGSDDLMKRIVRQNLGSSATATRDLSSYGFMVEADSSYNFNMAKKFAWRNVLAVLNDIVSYSLYVALEQHEPQIATFFDVEPLQLDENSIGWRFITRRGQLGVNRSTVRRNTYPYLMTASSVDPTVFSKEQGNLENSRLFYDYSGEITYIYAGGEGEAADRVVSEKSDTARVKLSAWNRRERFINYSNQENTTALDDRAKQGVAEGNPKIKFTGNLKDTPDTRYGKHWRYGDKVTAQYRNLSFDVIISAVGISVSEDGQEKIDARFEVFV